MTGIPVLGLMIVSWGLVIALGALLCFYSFRSYRRTGTRPMLLLGIGFVFLSMATAASWFTLYFAFDNPLGAAFGCVAMLAAGFGVILYGLRTRFV